ncbi:MAG TPA: Yip1 family protein [Gaiellaceae bacterium]|nr:Yip1 family protein [Gaiellaceae bacterium]
MEGAEREWWRRLPRVLTAPREVFAALRNDDPDDVVARQEPVLLLVLLVGMAGVVMSPRWSTLLDEPDVDGWLIVAVLTFIAGGLYGAVGYFLVGGALHLGARGMGAEGRFRLARHVLAFACVPLALAFVAVLPLRLLAFGGDTFRSGGSDDGVLGGLVLALQLGLLAWTLALLLVGVRVVYGWTWLRAAGALALLALFLAAFVALPSAF